MINLLQTQILMLKYLNYPTNISANNETQNIMHKTISKFTNTTFIKNLHVCITIFEHLCTHFAFQFVNRMQFVVLCIIFSTTSHLIWKPQ